VVRTPVPPGFLTQECASSRKEKGSFGRMLHKSAQDAENKEAEKRAPNKECVNGGKKGLTPAEGVEKGAGESEGTSRRAQGLVITTNDSTGRLTCK